MLSICIPVYNYPIEKLLTSLSKQIECESLPIEIVVMDDGSDESFRQLNLTAEKTPYVNMHYQANVGRSQTRNRLANLAKYDYLAFLDCDCLVADNYVSTYIKHLHASTILVGGVTYPARPKEKNKRLRWKTGVCREVKNHLQRQANPYGNFLSSNFVTPKKLMTETGFSEELSGYGHEDTLLGIELEHKSIPILHIDNPVCHMGIDTAAEYLAKLDQSITNLKRIEELGLVRNQIKLLKTYLKIKKMGVDWIFSTVFVVVKPMLKFYFLKGGTNLFLLDMYKLGSYCMLNRINTSR